MNEWTGVLWNSTVIYTKPCIWEGRVHCNDKSWELLFWKGWRTEHEPAMCPGSKGGQQYTGLYLERPNPSVQGKWLAPLLSISGTIPRTVYPILGADRYWLNGASSAKDHRTGEPILWGEAGRAGFGHWRSDGFWGCLSTVCQCLTGGHQDNKARLYPVVCSGKMRAKCWNKRHSD